MSSSIAKRETATVEFPLRENISHMTWRDRWVSGGSRGSGVTRIEFALYFGWLKNRWKLSFVRIPLFFFRKWSGVVWKKRNHKGCSKKNFEEHSSLSLKRFLRLQAWYDVIYEPNLRSTQMHKEISVAINLVICYFSRIRNPFQNLKHRKKIYFFAG